MLRDKKFYGCCLSLIMTMAILLSLHSVTVAQQTVINGKVFQKQNGEWFQLENGKSYKVDTKVITVKYKTGVTAGTIDQYLAQKNIDVLRRNILAFVDLKIPNGSDPIAVVQGFINSGLVEIAEPNTIGKYIVIPNDQYFINQWSLNNTGQSGGSSDADIDAAEAWNIETGSSSILIGILDSGTDWLHSDLGLGADAYQNIWLNPGEDAWTSVPSNPNDPCIGNGIDDDGNGFIDDYKGWDFDPVQNNNNSRGFFFHGTHVAGITSAKTNNNTGIAGVVGGWNAQGSQLMILSVGNDDPYSSVLDDAILYAAANGANIIQMSLSVGQTTAINAALQSAYQTYGCFIDCAAGNDYGGAVRYPANNQYVFGVSATDHNDNFATYSNKGPEIDASAPGSNIYSLNLNNGYTYASGTSMAAPHVAGVAALILSANPNLTNVKVEQIIEQTANDKGATGFDYYYGYGRINAHQAILLALAYSNKSTKGSATGPNNQHILERGHHGDLHEVFASGGEIFYRRSSNNGSSWNITKRLSGANGDNSSVSIAAGSDPTYDNLRAVWQRKINNTHYEIWYSYSLNSGSSWSAPAIVNGCSNVTISYSQSTAGYAGGPTPVAASYWRGGAEGNASFLLVYAASNGLHYRYATDANNGWTIPGNDMVPGATSSSSWYPSLASYNNTSYKVHLIYGERYPGHIYHQYFNQNVTWSSRTQADNFNNYNRLASIAVDNTGAPIVAWCGQNPSYSGQYPNGRYTITYKQGNTSGSWIYTKE